MLGVAGEFFHSEIADRNAEIVAGNFFEFVGFIEDDGTALGKNAGIGSAVGFELDGEVGEEKMVVDDDDVAFGGAPTHLGDEAALVLFAFLTEAGIGAGVEFVPEHTGFGQFGEFGAVAGTSGFFPGGDGAVLFDFIEAGKNGLIGEIVKFLPAEIVVAALHVADGEAGCLASIRRTPPRLENREMWGTLDGWRLRKECAFKKRDIFEEQLLLQVFCAGGNDDAFAGTDDGKKVSESFAGAGARLDDEVALFLEGFFD